MDAAAVDAVGGGAGFGVAGGGGGDAVAEVGVVVAVLVASGVGHPVSCECRYERLRSGGMKEVLLLLLGGLVVSPTTYWLQQGGRRKRMRAELLSEIDLRGRLDSRPDAQQRLDRRIDDLLARYVPAADQVKVPDPVPWTLAVGVGTFALMVVFNEVVYPLSSGALAVAGAVVGLVSSSVPLAVDAVARRRLAAHE